MQRQSNLSNHPGLCDECKRWAEAILVNDVDKLKVGAFARKYLHLHAHYELRRAFLISRGVWASLPAYLGKEGIED